MTEQHRPEWQNDPDRADGLIADAVGEFVEEHPGGAFDPRTFRAGDDQHLESDPAPAGTGGGTAPDAPAGPPMDDERMVGPGEEAGKAR